MPDYSERKKEIDQLKKDIYAAQSIIRDGISRYRKKKLRARSKKQAEDLSHFEPFILPIQYSV